MNNIILFIKWDVNPEIFRIGSFGLRYYSLCFAAAFLIGSWLIRRFYRREGLNEKELNPLIAYLLIGTIAGARLGQAFFYEFSYFKQHPLEILLPFRFTAKGFEWTGYQGLASHGGAIGVLLALVLYSKRYHRPLLALLDHLVIPIALAACLIRLGNLFNSEIIGKPANVPWAFVFVRVDLLPRHPAQLYESIVYGLLFLFLLRQYTIRPLRKPGYLTGWFLLVLFAARFLIEFIKEDQAAFEKVLPLNMGQLLSIPFMLAGLYLLLRKHRLEPHSNAP